MKTLIMVRHAKSDWSNSLLKDFGRPLNERGKKDAPEMGKRLKARKIKLDKILCSSSVRTMQTAKKIARELEFDKDEIEYVDDLYHATARQIREVMYGANNKWDTLMIVCHNTGVTDFINSVCGFITDNVPTCGIAVFRIDAKKWEDFPQAQKELWFYDFPKNILSA